VAGGLLGGALGTIGGPPGIAAGAFGGVAATRVIKRLGAELYARVLAPRQRARAGRAFGVAAERIQERTEAGEQARTDGFFDAEPGERAPADELLEGVLIQAANAYQERKVPHMGALFASLAFRDDISPAHAHYLLRLANRLTYRQLTAIAYFAENAESHELIRLQTNRDESGRPAFAEALGSELNERGDELRLLGIPQPGGMVVPSSATYGANSFESTQLRNVTLTALGRELYEVMELSRIPEADKAAIFEAMERPTRGATSTE
jgi:hypothetical protein